jgi:hypothetical protein
MHLTLYPLLLFGLAPWLLGGGLSLPGAAGAGAFAAVRRDLGPEGIYVDMQGHDKDDEVAGEVTYNNQARMPVHIQSIYVHGKNIKTQGLFSVNLDIEAGAKVTLLEILRDKIGESATVAVDVHFQ